MMQVKMAEIDKAHAHRRGAHRKRRRPLLKLVILWSVLMIALLFVGQKLWRGETPQRKIKSGAETNTAMMDEDAAFSSKVYPKCAKVFADYLRAESPEARNQFVHAPLDTIRMMARFYQMNPLGRYEVSKTQGAGVGVIHLNDGRRLLDTRWKMGDGSAVDAVFIDEKGEWKLDWGYFVRYSDETWLLFLADSGDGEGEFRLYARERHGESGAEGGPLRIALHAPKFGEPKEVGPSSKEFLVDQDSEAGRRLNAAFKLRKEGKRIYASKLPDQDPEGMIRVRVKIRRESKNGEKTFTIETVKACHWLSVDDPGVSP